MMRISNSDSPRTGLRPCPPQRGRAASAPNSTTAEIVAAKNAGTMMIGDMGVFIGRKVANIRGKPTAACADSVVPYAEPCLAADHAIIGVSGPVQRIDLVHRTHAGEDAEGERVLAGRRAVAEGVLADESGGREGKFRAELGEIDEHIRRPGVERHHARRHAPERIVALPALPEHDELGSVLGRDVEDLVPRGAASDARLDVNSALLAYAVSSEDGDWARFQTVSAELNAEVRCSF